MMRHLCREGKGEWPPMYANFVYRREMGYRWGEVLGDPALPLPAWVYRIDQAIITIERTIPRKRDGVT